MTTRVGVGSSKAQDGFLAACAATKAAIEQLEGGRPDFLLVFATTGYDQDAVMRGVAEVGGSTPMSGCSTEGIITRGRSDEESHALSVMAFASDAIQFTPFHVPEIKDPIAAADALAQQLNDHTRLGPDQLLLVFPDGLTLKTQALVRRLDEKLASPLPVAGGGAGAILDTWRTYQYHQGQATSGGLTAVLLDGRFVAEMVVSHGCEPIGVPRTITDASDDGFVRTIDGVPAWEVFKEYIDGEPTNLLAADLVHLSLGRELPVEHRDGYGKLIIATAATHDTKTGALFFPADLEMGTKVYMTRRDPDRVRDSGITACRRIKEAHPAEQPTFVLQFDCVNRGRVLFGEDTASMTINPLHDILGYETPWMGAYTYGEIAPLSRRTYYHNNTVVLCAFYERDVDAKGA